MILQSKDIYRVYKKMFKLKKMGTWRLSVIPNGLLEVKNQAQARVPAKA